MTLAHPALDLSVVVPAYNERGRLPASIRRIAAYLRAAGVRFEIIVVDDGSTDGTAAIAAAELAGIGRIVRSDVNRGKGAAVRTGVLIAEGPRILVTDADLSAPIEELPKLMDAARGGVHVAIGSRALNRGLVLRAQPAWRDRSGRLFNGIVRLVALPGIHDTQCGFKLFDAAAARMVFTRQRIAGFGFDVEVLVIARHLGFRIAEVPVQWRNSPESRVSLGAGLLAFLDPLRIRLRLRRGDYDVAVSGGAPATDMVGRLATASPDSESRLPVS